MEDPAKPRAVLATGIDARELVELLAVARKNLSDAKKDELISTYQRSHGQHQEAFFEMRSPVTQELFAWSRWGFFHSGIEEDNKPTVASMAVEKKLFGWVNYQKSDPQASQPPTIPSTLKKMREMFGDELLEGPVLWWEMSCYVQPQYYEADDDNDRQLKRMQDVINWLNNYSMSELIDGVVETMDRNVFPELNIIIRVPPGAGPKCLADCKKIEPPNGEIFHSETEDKVPLNFFVIGGKLGDHLRGPRSGRGPIEENNGS